MAKQFTTSELWDTAHSALCAKDWSVAFRTLALLQGRADASDLLADARAYGAPEHLVLRLQASLTR